jgi:hypothetical protein
MPRERRRNLSFRRPEVAAKRPSKDAVEAPAKIGPCLKSAAADFRCRRPSRLATLAPQDDGSQDKQSRSRDATSHPSYAKPRSRKREGGVRRQTGGGARLDSSLKPHRKPVAWMKRSEIRGNPRSRSRVSLRSTRATKERMKERSRKRNADRRNFLFCRGVGHGRARRPVVVPARRKDPKPPGSVLQARPRAPHSPAQSGNASRAASDSLSETRSCM